MSWLSGIHRCLRRGPHLPQVPGGWARRLGAGGRGPAALASSGRAGRRPAQQVAAPPRSGRPRPHPHPHGGAPLTVTPAAPHRVERGARDQAARGAQAHETLAGSASPRPFRSVPDLGGAQRQRGCEGARRASRSQVVAGPQRDALPLSSTGLPDSGQGKSAGQTGGPDRGRGLPPLL